jgi:thiamine biosynthesis lipoprotein
MMTDRDRAVISSARALTVLVVLLVAAGLSLSCVHRRPLNPAAYQRFEFTRPEMGVPFRMVVYATNQQHATEASRAAFARVAELNSILSDYDSDSELSRLSQTSGLGFDVPVGPDLWQVMTRALRLSRRSEGAFDVTVGPVVNLWRKARREQKLPRPDLLAQARARVGWRKVRLDTSWRAVRLEVENMRLDLGGIAKGYAVDEALKVLAARGISAALVSGGGDLAVSASPPGRNGWQITLAASDATNAPAAEHVILQHAALATSGDVFQHVEIDGMRYSHIVDPRTGIGLTDHSLVNIIARDCTTADGLATAVSVLGPEKGLRLARSMGAAARIVRAPAGRMETHQSPDFAQWLEP